MSLFRSARVEIGVVVLAVVALAPDEARAQSDTGEIQGVVQDASGAVLPGVLMTLVHQASGVARTSVTEGDGRYRFPALGPGTYSLAAELQGFAVERVVDIEITIGLHLRRDFALKLQAVQETIVVKGEPTVVDTTKSEVSGVITQRQLENLPINSRSYLSLALMMPGTSLDATRSFFPTVNVGGSMTFNSTGNYVDGVINNFAEDGEPRQNLPQSAVEEFKVTNVQYKAEFGLATAGIVQVVTRSGTNAFHGDVFEYFRDKSLNALGVFETVKPEFRRHQFGASVGGPIRLNRMHFFGAAERSRIDEFFTVRTGLPQFYSAVEGTFKKPFYRNLYFGRADYQISNTQTAFARYLHEDEKSTCGGCGGTAAGNSGFDQETPRRALVVGHTWVRGTRQLNDLRFQVASAGYFIAPAGTEISKGTGAFPAERLARQTTQLRFPTMIWGSTFDEVGPESRWQVKNTYAVNVGAHDVKIGGDISYMPYTEEVANGYAGTFNFTSDQPFNPSDPFRGLTAPAGFSATLPPISTSRPTKYYAGFVQDDWKVRPNVTLNLGLRYERLYGCCNEDLDVTFPIPIPYINVDERGDTNNFGPRTGVAWDVLGDGDTVVRGGYGMYYGHVRILGNLNEFRNYKRFPISITNPSFPDPYGGRDPLTFASTAPVNITVVANDYVQPYSHQFSAGVSQRLPLALALHVDAVVTNTNHDRKIQDINPRDPVTRVRPNPTFARVDRNQSTGKLRYRALYTKLERRFAQRSQFLVSHTYTRSRDNNIGSRYLDPFDESLDWGPSSGERRHAVVASGSVLLPGDVTIGAAWTARSQLPWTATAGTDRNLDNFFTDLVPGTTRNSGSRNLDLDAVNRWRAANNRAPIPASQIDSSRVNLVDLRVKKQVRLGDQLRADLLAQVFNLFDTKNLQDQFAGGRVSSALSERLGKILAARPGAQGELAVRLIW